MTQPRQRHDVDPRVLHCVPGSPAESHAQDVQTVDGSMTEVQWDPRQYLTYGDHRLRPFVELMSRVFAEHPSSIIDLGCGPGNATVLLASRWTGASVLGLDASEAMIAEAMPREIAGAVRFELGDAHSFRPDREVDVLISNATLQWVPGHLQLFPRFVEMLAPDGWFAFQVPGMRQARSHQLLYSLASSPRWTEKLAPHVRSMEVETLDQYISTLAALGCEVDAWETTYSQILEGDDAVLEWIKGSSVRPFTSVLDASEGAEFVEQLRLLLAEAYPKGRTGTIYPFRRLFVVAHRRR
jgi:trans-aconitate 2-methyltransferase